MTKHDFPALVAKVMVASSHHPDEPLPPENHWNVGYAQAIEQVIEQGNATALVRMLDAGLPIHPVMLPALADAVRVLSRGRRSGAHRALTSIEEEAIVSAIRVRNTHGKTSIASAQEALAAAFGVSVDTVKRAWRKRRRTLLVR